MTPAMVVDAPWGRRALQQFSGAPAPAAPPAPGASPTSTPTCTTALIVLGALLAVLSLMLIVGLLHRRSGCKLWRPSTWQHPGHAELPGQPSSKQAAAAAALPEIQVVPVLVVMPDEQVQCALEEHAAAESTCGEPVHPASAAITLAPNCLPGVAAG
ncbi:hypothetical protein ABPG75_010018 [Micractinium tetrahymenae]